MYASRCGEFFVQIYRKCGDAKEFREICRPRYCEMMEIFRNFDYFTLVKLCRAYWSVEWKFGFAYWAAREKRVRWGGIQSVIKSRIFPLRRWSWQTSRHEVSWPRRLIYYVSEGYQKNHKTDIRTSVVGKKDSVIIVI